MGMVVAPVQINPHIHIPVFNGRGFSGQGQHQPELVKSAARRPGPVFQTSGGTSPVSAMRHVLASRSGVHL
jgi:hypothetical protein